MDPINIPQMLAYIPAPWILWDITTYYNWINWHSEAVEMCWNVLKCVEMCWNVLKCVEMCWNVLKCVEMCVCVCVCVLTLGKSRSKLAACWRTKLELCLCGFLQGLVFLAEHKPPMHNPRSQDNPNQNDPSTVRQHRNPMETNRNHRNFC